MKYFIISVVSSFILLNSDAQDPNYNGPAKIVVKQYWDGVIKLEQSIAAGGSNLDKDVLISLGRKIQDTKAKDGYYNTDAMETKFKALSEGIVIVQTNKNKDDNTVTKNMVAKKVVDLLTYLFDGNINDHIPEIMRAKTEELFALDRSGNMNTLNLWKRRLKKNAEETKLRYPKLEKICREQTKLIEIQNYYRHFQSYQAYWDAAQKIFPEEPAFSESYSIITNILNGLGNENDLLVLVGKNYDQKVKDTRLPLAKVKDATLEKLFINAYDQQYSESNKGKATKAIITSDDWQIQRNEITGSVTSRLRKGAILYKNADGQCRLIEEFFIQQEYVGNSFVGTKSVYAVGKGQEILCSNVK